MEHPDLVDTNGSKEDWNFIGGCAGCPEDHGYETDRDYGHHCSKTNCTECWNRVIPGTEPTTTNSYEKLGVELHDMYTSFRNSGFTDEQALELVKSFIAAGADSMKN